MAILLMLFVIFACFHFVLQNVIVPYLQLELKNNLYRILFEVTNLKAIYKRETQRRVLNGLESSIILTLNNISKHNFVDFILFTISKSELEKNESKLKTEKIYSQVVDSKIDGIEKLFARYFKAIRNLFFVSSGITIYLSPLLILYYSLKWVNNGLSNRKNDDLDIIKRCEPRHLDYEKFERLHTSFPKGKISLETSLSFT